MNTRLAFPFVTSFLLLTASLPLSAAVVITPSAGFSLTWDGNEGDHFNAAESAPVPANLATGGSATPFTSSDLGPQLNIPFHRAVNLNDGLYSNGNSWIGGDDFPGAPYAGISLGGSFLLNGFAFGRDNGNASEVVPGGQLTDRSLGNYTIQITQVANPGSGTADTGDVLTGWQTLGTLNYAAADDEALGGAFTPWFRHEYAISSGGSAILATGLRILVPGTGLGGQGTAIDEIEIFGAAVPEPSTTGLTALTALGALTLRRRRRMVG